MSKCEILKSRLKENKILVAPGASAALLAVLVELGGFECVYITGAGVSNMNFAYPDLGFVSMSEMLEITKRINDSVKIPTIVDIDNGYGNALNVARSVREFSFLEVGALQIEDQILPKRCGHFDGKAIISKDEMISKIKSAKDNMIKDALLIARTDALAIYGIGDALDRANAYKEAGADILFIEAPRSAEDMKKIVCVNSYHIANMVEGGKTPILDNVTLENIGFNIVLYANAPLKAAIKGVKDLLNRLKEQGSTKDANDLMITMKERNIITNLDYFSSLEQKYKS